MRRLIILLGFTTALSAQTHWVGTWGAAPAPQGDQVRKFTNETLREIVHVSLGGQSIRLRLSVAFSTEDSNIGAVSVGLCSADSLIVAGSDRVVTFSGHASMRIPKGGVVISDPIELK